MPLGGDRGAWNSALSGRRLPCPRPNDVFHQADFFEQPDGNPGDVEFPPLVAVGGSPLVGMVVVVPAFAVAPQADEDVVAAVIVRLVVAIPPDVGHRVHRPGNVPRE